MESLKHKVLGEGSIIARNGDVIRVKFSKDGSEKDFIFPISFTTGLFELEGSFKEEVEAALNTAKEEHDVKVATILSALENPSPAATSPKKSKSQKSPAKITVKHTIEEEFERFLIKSGYSEITPSGLPSTVYSYTKAVNSILEEEHLTWSELVNQISHIIPLYSQGGAKEDIGNKSNQSYINALHRFEDFVNNSNLAPTP